MIKENAANPHQIENIDFDKFITKLDPDILWKVVFKSSSDDRQHFEWDHVTMSMV